MKDAASSSRQFPDSLPAESKSDRSLLPWIVAAVTVVLLIVLAFVIGGNRPKSRLRAPDASAYAQNLVLSQVQMSQASNFAGSQLTYIDGVISNRGAKTVTNVVVRALFANDSGEPQAEEVPFTLIRTRDPYVDTQPVSAAPLAPGASREFRLIYDDVSPMWNQQLPQLQIMSVTTRQP